MEDRIEREVLVDASLERVWSLMTEPEHLGSWFADAGAEIDLRPGGDLTLRWAKYGAVRGRVERVEEPHAFAFRWETGGTGGDELTPENSTRVEFSLSGSGDGTLVRVVETGFESLALDDEKRHARFADNTEGWRQELGHLVEHSAKVAA